MALSAISTSRKLSLQVKSDLAYHSVSAQQAEFAFKQYQKALKEMRTCLEKAGDSRKALIACLLVCCFESLVGNMASAHVHAISGQKLLRQWLAQYPYTKPHEAGIASPANNLIEDDIIQAGTFFDSQIVSSLDDRPADVHAALRHEGDQTVAQIPKKFQSIKIAYRYLFLIYRRCLHFSREVAELAGDGRLSTTSNLRLSRTG